MTTVPPRVLAAAERAFAEARPPEGEGLSPADKFRVMLAAAITAADQARTQPPATPAPTLPTEPGSVAEVERARGAAERALALIAGTSCENSTSGPGACWRDYRDPNAKYGAERWCDPCIALAALTPDATDKLWQEHPGIDQHDEVAAGGDN